MNIRCTILSIDIPGFAVCSESYHHLKRGSPMKTYVSPLVVSFPEASSIVGAGVFSFLVPNIRFISCRF